MGWLKVNSSIIGGIDKMQLNQKKPETEKGEIIKMENTVRQIDLLCKQLKNEVDFGGLRFASIRMTKVVVKSLFLVYIYQIYYCITWFMRHESASNYFLA